MAIVRGDLRAALVNAGARYEARLAGVETRLSVLTWMAAANIAIGVATMFRVFD